MAEFVTWAATVVVVALLVTFILHLISLRRLPTTERPRTNVYDRQGHLIGQHENPAATEGTDEGGLPGAHGG